MTTVDGAMEKVMHFASYPSLRNRAVIITGGASGIGASLVEAFAGQMSRVAFLDIERDAGAKLVKQLQDRGFSAPLFHHCDLTDTRAISEAVVEIAGKLGAVDVLVNNAANDVRHSIEETTSERWDELVAINLKSQFFMCQAVLPAMRRAGRGAIVNMSSISWLIPSVNMPVYITAKAGIVGLTRTMARELGKDEIRVNCVLPGAILTEKQARLWFSEEYKAEILARQALKRMLLPQEVARLVLFLAADDSSAITNQSYVIDGGWI